VIFAVSEQRVGDAAIGNEAMIKRILSLVASGVILMLAMPVTANAQEMYATTTVNLRTGPGTNYAILGALRPNEIVTALRCNATNTWCEVTSRVQRGWVSARYLAPLSDSTRPTFPVRPQPLPVPQPVRPPVPPRPGITLPVEPQVCFYDDYNYEGREMCAGANDYARTLTRLWDDSIRSARLDRGVEVMVCTEAYLRGRCETIDRSIRDFGQFADDISSYRVTATR